MKHLWTFNRQVLVVASHGREFNSHLSNTASIKFMLQDKKGGHTVRPYKFIDSRRLVLGNWQRAFLVTTGNKLSLLPRGTSNEVAEGVRQSTCRDTACRVRPNHWRLIIRGYQSAGIGQTHWFAPTVREARFRGKKRSKKNRGSTPPVFDHLP